MKWTRTIGFITKAILLFVSLPTSASPNSSKPCALADGSWGTCIQIQGFQQEGEPGVELFAIVRQARKRAIHPPIYLLAGGPGQGASKVFASLSEPFNSLQENHDIVILDQRGTGRSNPLQCPHRRPSLREILDDARQSQFFSECHQELAAKYHLPSFSSHHAVQDIELLRQYLGHERISLYGISYGTRLAIHYARQFPANLESLVLEGVLSHDYILYQEPENFRNALNAVFRACETELACKQQYPNLAARYQALRSKMANGLAIRLRHPYSGITETVTANSYHLDRALAINLYDSLTISMIPHYLAQAEAGQFQALFALSLSQKDDVIADGLYLNIVCSEDIPFITQEEASIDPGILQACQNWGRFQVAADFRMASTIETPSLLLSGGFDPVTPPRYAHQLKEQLPNARMVELDHFSHNIHPVACVQKIIRDFLANKGVDEALCEQDKPAFHFFSHRGPLQ